MDEQSLNSNFDPNSSFDPVSNSNSNPNSNPLINVTSWRGKTLTITPTETEKESPRVIPGKVLNDVRAQFKSGGFTFEEPKFIGDFCTPSKLTKELIILSENVRREFELSDDENLTCCLFRVNHPSFHTFIIENLFLPNFFGGTCFITWLETNERGGAYHSYWNGDAQRTLLEDDKVWKFEGGKVMVDEEGEGEGRGGVYLALVHWSRGEKREESESDKFKNKASSDEAIVATALKKSRRLVRAALLQRSRTNT